ARKKRHQRVRSKIMGDEKKPRFSVFRSNKYNYVQLIDDEKGRTLVSASDLELKKKELTKTEKAFALGKLIAQAAKEKGLKKVVFDRSGYLYHGRVKAVAEGAREGGLEF
ncbi:MAG: 50S ribosomal protein L18, partial [Candidatus Omnitrophica bacterium]|nr:50S ribosomal protein L18 [Candidatus Omnitrophota bacterium]